MNTRQILTDLHTEHDRIDRAIAALEGLDGTGRVSVTPGTQPAASQPRGRRTMSVAARKKIAEAQRKRWAERKATTARIDEAAPVQASGRRTVSAASRKKMAESQRKRWAAQKRASQSPSAKQAALKQTEAKKTAPMKTVGKGGNSTAGRKRLSVMMKTLWTGGRNQKAKAA